MEELIFYPKKPRTSGFWKFISFMLLSAGASSVTDVEKVIAGEKLIIKKFMEEDIILKYDEIKIIYGKKGEPVKLIGKRGKLDLEIIQNAEKLTRIINEKSKIFNNK